MSAFSTTPADPKELRPLLHAEVYKLRDENLLVLHRVALELELDEVTDRLNQGFDADRTAGKLARVPGMIRDAHGALHSRKDAVLDQAIQQLLSATKDTAKKKGKPLDPVQLRNEGYSERFISKIESK